MAACLRGFTSVTVWVSDPGIFYSVNAEASKMADALDVLVADVSGETGLSHKKTFGAAEGILIHTSR